MANCFSIDMDAIEGAISRLVQQESTETMIIVLERIEGLSVELRSNTKAETTVDLEDLNEYFPNVQFYVYTDFERSNDELVARWLEKIEVRELQSPGRNLAIQEDEIFIPDGELLDEDFLTTGKPHFCFHNKQTPMECLDALYDVA